jgi:hypothetical protein
MFFQLSEFVIYDHISHYLEFQINTYQFGFTESKSAIRNLATCLDFIAPFVGSQRQGDVICFDLSI